MHRKKNIILKTVAIIIATVFFSCTEDLKNIQQLDRAATVAVGVAEDINLKHTDSGKVKVHLISKKMMDFSNKDFGYTTFPDGLEVHFYSEENQKTTVTSDYAILYNKTDLIDLRGNVKVVMHDGKKLSAKQLYYDQKSEWLFTNSEYKYEGEDGGYNVGKGGFDANKDFTIFSSLDNDGQQYIND